MFYSMFLSLQENLPEESRIRELLDQFLVFIDTTARWAGELVVAIINMILDYNLSELTVPIGYLVLITAFLALAEVAKKISWLVVIVGWVLIVLRIILELFPTQ